MKARLTIVRWFCSVAGAIAAKGLRGFWPPISGTKVGPSKIMNFAHALLCRLGKAPHLIDGASGARLDDVRGHVIATASDASRSGARERGSAAFGSATGSGYRRSLSRKLCMLGAWPCRCPRRNVLRKQGPSPQRPAQKAIWSSTLRESSALPVIVGVGARRCARRQRRAEPTDIAVLNATSGIHG
jgi:hypothetical protein